MAELTALQQAVEALGHLNSPVHPFQAPCWHSPLVQWHWECPRCGQDTIAYWAEQATPTSIAADARCHWCRQERKIGQEAPL